MDQDRSEEAFKVAGLYHTSALKGANALKSIFWSALLVTA